MQHIRRPAAANVSIIIFKWETNMLRTILQTYSAQYCHYRSSKRGSRLEQNSHPPLPLQCLAVLALNSICFLSVESQIDLRSLRRNSAMTESTTDAVALVEKKHILQIIDGDGAFLYAFFTLRRTIFSLQSFSNLPTLSNCCVRRGFSKICHLFI